MAGRSSLKRNTRTLTFQSLESRAMMTGNVTVSVVNGDLKINGDSKDNEITVVQAVTQGTAEPGRFYVTGLNGTRINGNSAGAYFNNVTRDFAISLGGGNDRLTLGDGVSDLHFFVPRNLNINTGSGLNHVDLKTITVTDNTTINGGGDRDFISIKGSNFGETQTTSGHGNVSINADAGYDMLWIETSAVKRDLTIDMGKSKVNDKEAIDIELINVGHNLKMTTYGGEDTVTIDDIFVGHDLTINTGDKGDYIQLENSDIRGTIFGNFGAGNDLLKLDSNTYHSAKFNGEGNTDSIFESNDTFDSRAIGSFELQHLS
jgi:hypothetical protein